MKKIRLAVQRGKRPIEPLELFNRLTLRGSIENIWEPQADALKEWHRMREHQDLVIQMNTGGGKTLVGLLIAQSLTNESRGQVVYACPTNQLVEQTLQHAREVGLTPSARYNRQWLREPAFESGESFCITNYASLFNGRSIFRNVDMDAIVFDDAHVADSAIRSQFTLRIPRSHESFQPILNHFKKHFVGSSQALRYQEVVEGSSTSTLFVPAFAFWQRAGEVRKTLLDHGVDSAQETLFVWEHLKENLRQCCMIATSQAIEIAPIVLPLARLRYFSGKVRRLYLTATMPSAASFTRTFGIAPPQVIAPSGRSGDAQRLFVFVPGKEDAAQRSQALRLVEDRKACVISPSAPMGQEWSPPATIYDSSSGQAEIDRFRASKEPELLGLIARYDGIDLPGDACRVLILDRLPRGETLLERFLDESIQIESIRIVQTATRLVQAIGRIFRSNTDHGVVLLVGTDLMPGC